MERWRWLPRELGAPTLGDAYVILNIPDYTLKVMQNGAQVWTTRVVTGKPGNARDAAADRDDEVHHGQSDLERAAVDHLQRISAGAAAGSDRAAAHGPEAGAATATAAMHISQPPGEANALGRIRFNFPNKFLVYQHDTPDKNLFAKDERAFSHGCMRVQNPDQYAAMLLNIAHAERQLHAGEDPQHVRPQRDRPEIPDADPGQHHLPDRLRG